ncbi:MAG: hypothetical protein QXF56_05735 [Candidatus Micrarchaeia archaeon]
MGAVDEAVFNLDSAVRNSIEKIIIDLIVFIPKFLLAILVFVVGWVLASLACWVVERVFEYLKVEKFLKSHKLDDSLGKVRITNVLAKLTKYYIMLIFLQAAVAMINLGTITQFIYSLLMYTPVVIGALLLIVAAAVLGELLKEKIIEIENKSKTVRWLASATKAVIVFMAIMVGLSTIGFDTAIVTNSFVQLVQGIVYGIAFAFGLAFGLGGQEDAKEIIRNLRKKTGI